jgi:hypothetical protein
MALPEPARDGDLELLRPFVNCTERWPLVVAFVATALRFGGPYPILILKGNQGSAKSTTARMLGELIDPSTSRTLTPAKDLRDLTAYAKNHWLLNFDNLSSLSSEMADAACRLATGGGLGGRQLYTNDDTAVFEAQRPQIYNGIVDLADSRPDFHDRSLVVELQRPEKYESEKDLWKRFNSALPPIFGGFLDIMVTGLANLPSVPGIPDARMQDFVRWAEACEKGSPAYIGRFAKDYAASRDDSIQTGLEASAIFRPLKRLLDNRGGKIEATAKDLLDRLNENATFDEQRAFDWPKAPNALSNRLKRLEPGLQKIGIEIARVKTNHDRIIRIQGVTAQ